MSLKPPTQGTPSTATFESRIASVESSVAVVKEAPLNVRHAEYGAVGDNSHDDTAALQAAVAAVGAFGGEIYLPAGIYRCSSTLVLPTKVTIHGDGENRSEIRRTADTPLLRFAGTANTATFINDLTLEKLTLNGNGFQTGGGFGSNLVEFLEVNHVHCDHIRFYDVPGTGIYIRAGENMQFRQCRFSILGTTTGSNKAGTEIENNTAVETNGIKWIGCDFEVTTSGRDIHILGDVTRKASNFVWDACKFESQGSPYAPSQRVFLERVDEFVFQGTKFIRGQGVQLDMSLCANGRIIGCHFIDGQGTYGVWFRDGGAFIIDNCQFQGSAAMSAAGGAHVRVESGATVKIGKTTHQVVGTELKIDDQSGTGRRATLTADILGTALVFQKSGVTAAATVTMGTVIGSLVDYVLPRAGKVVAISLDAGAGSTSGALTATLQKNGVDTALTTVLAQAATTAYNDAGFASGVQCAAGDRVRVTLTAPAGFTPTATAYNAVLFFVPDPVST